MESAYFKVTEIAKTMGVKAATVRKWCRSGRLRAFKPGGKTFLIERSDFEEFMSLSKKEG